MTTFPIGSRITLTELETDPHPHLHRLREKEPISWVPVLNGWLVTRRDWVVAMMRDTKTYTVDHPNFSTAQVVGPSMLSLDGERHRQQRAPFEIPFRKAAILHRFSDRVRHTVDRLLDDMASRGEMELRRDYAAPIAVHTMVDALGLEADIPVSTVLTWYDNIVEAVTQVTRGQPVSTIGRTAFDNLRQSLLFTLNRPSESSLLATASGMAMGLSEEEVVSNAAVLLFGGIETTEGMIANAFYHLLTEPQVLSRVQRDPSLMPSVLEESLRLEPAAAVIDRYATQDVSVSDGVTIKAGDLVRLSLSGANRDPQMFPDPDTFDPLRPNLRDHVTFAHGPHVCLGLHLARLEAHFALERAITRLPNLHLPPENRPQAQPRGLVFRKPPAVVVRW